MAFAPKYRSSKESNDASALVALVAAFVAEVAAFVADVAAFVSLTAAAAALAAAAAASPDVIALAVVSTQVFVAAS